MRTINCELSFIENTPIRVLPMTLRYILPDEILCVQADWLWDGVSDTLLSRPRLLIRQGRIAAISSCPHARDQRSPGTFPERVAPPGTGSPGTIPAESMPVLHLPGCTLLPPLIDAHVHLGLDGRDFAASRAAWQSEKEYMTRVARHAAEWLAAGVVALRDGGDAAATALHYRQSKNPAWPLLRTTGMALRHPERYGSFLGPDWPAKKLGDLVEELAARGVDWIKILVSGVVSFTRYGRVGALHFSWEELTALVARARSLGRRVMAHANSPEGVKQAVRAGAATIEHGYFLDEDCLKEMAEKQTAWLPTIVPVANQVRTALATGWPAENRRVIEKTYRRQQEMLYKAWELGVPLGLGSDAGASGVEHGRGLLQEMLYYREAGLPAVQVLRLATRGNAAILGITGALPGVIVPGAPAALLAVRGNPLADLHCLERVKQVMLPASPV